MSEVGRARNVGLAIDRSQRGSKPPCTSSLWLAASASAGASRSVGVWSRDQRMGESVLQGVQKVVGPADQITAPPARLGGAIVYCWKWNSSTMRNIPRRAPAD